MTRNDPAADCVPLSGPTIASKPPWQPPCRALFVVGEKQPQNGDTVCNVNARRVSGARQGEHAWKLRLREHLLIGQGILRSSLTDQPVVSTIQPSHDGAKGIAEARRVLLEIRTSVHGVEGVGVKDIGEFQHDQLIVSRSVPIVSVEACG